MMWRPFLAVVICYGHAFADMMGRFDKRLKEERKNPDYQMFKDELADHEYSYTGERVRPIT